MAKERWRRVKRYEDRYLVSDHGRVWSIRKEKFLLPCLAKCGGYPQVALYNGKHRTFCVHQLVLEAFVGPCPDGMLCRHFPDRDPSNCRLENLSWGTPAQNAADKVEHGTSWHGEKSPCAKLTDEKVRKMKRMYSTGEYSQARIGAIFGVSQSVAGDALNGTSYRIPSRSI